MNANFPRSVFSDIPRKYIFVLLGWSVLIAGSLLWNIKQQASETMSMSIATARTNISKDISFRKWVASHGGAFMSPPLSAPLLTLISRYQNAT
jgi:hypothetical protein